jgi:cold shock CspA family protein
MRARTAKHPEPLGSLREGQDVTFEVGQGPKGPRAENVRLA